MSHVLVRFPDDELLEGEAPDLDLDRDNFELLVAGDGRAVIPLPAVKCLTLHRRPIDPPARGDLGKIALHFRDGDVLTGLLAEAPRRSRFGVVAELISPDGTEGLRLGIPYESLGAVTQLASWECEEEEGTDVTVAWTGRRADTSLVDLLAGLRHLSDLRERGLLGNPEFARRRRNVLDRF